MQDDSTPCLSVVLEVDLECVAGNRCMLGQVGREGVGGWCAGRGIMLFGRGIPAFLGPSIEWTDGVVAQRHASRSMRLGAEATWRVSRRLCVRDDAQSGLASFLFSVRGVPLFSGCVAGAFSLAPFPVFPLLGLGAGVAGAVGGGLDA